MGAGRASNGDIDRLITICLEQFDAEGEGVIDRLCREHPEHAVELRRRIMSLRPSRQALDRTLSVPPLGSGSGPAEMAPPPTSLERYQILDELGRGGMGVVYRARDTRLERDVALKMLISHLSGDRALMQRFHREAKTLAAVNHPNIATIYSLEEHQGQFFIVLEYLPGRTLEQLVREAPLSAERTIAICKQIAEALEAAHSMGVIHRDLKPSNVIVSDRDHVKVLDFGLAKRRGTGEQDTCDVTQSGMILGTPRYMSPEQLSDSDVDHRADIWAFGCVLCECLTGEPAFTGDSFTRVALAILQGEPQQARIAPDTPPMLRELIASCLQKNVEQRIQHIRIAVEALQQSAPSAGIQPARIEGRLYPCRRHVTSGEDVAFRFVVRNRSFSACRPEIVVAPSSESWELLDASRVQIELAPGETRSGLLYARPSAAEGAVGTPGAEIILDDELVNALAPSTTTLRIDPPSPPLVGRHDLLQELSSTLENPGANPGELRIIVGEAGSGKSSVLEALAPGLRRGHVREVRGHGSGGSAQPLKPLLDVLRDLLGVVPMEHREASLRTFVDGSLSEYFGEDSPTTRYLSCVMLADPHDAVSAGVREQRWYRLLCAAAAEAPVVLLIEDLHDADDESLTLLRGLLEQCRQDRLPIALCATCRPPDTARPALDDLLGHASTTVHELEPLGRSEAELLIDRRYEGVEYRDDMPWLPDLVVERSGGNAAFVIELIEELSRAPAPIFEHDGTGWQPTTQTIDQLGSRLPGRYSDSLGRRLTEVSEAHREVLEFAALLDFEFPVSVLERLIDDTDQLDTALDQLEAGGFIRATDPELTRYRFSSRLIPGIVDEQGRQRGRRANLRRRVKVAAALIDEFGESAEYAERIGIILSDVGKPECVPYLLRAVENRLAHGQYAHGQGLLDRIESVYDKEVIPIPDQVRYRLLQSKVLTMRGRLDQAADTLATARSLAHGAGDEALHARVLVHLAEVDCRRGAFDSGYRCAEAALESAREAGAEDLVAHARNNLGTIRLNQARYEEARRLFTDNLDVYRHLGDLGGSAKTLNNLGIALYHSGRHDEARQRFTDASTIAETIENLDYQTTSLVWLANLQLSGGELDEARRGYTRAIESCRLLQNRRGLSRNYFNLAQVEWLEGRLDVARASAERALELTTEIGDKLRSIAYGFFLADLLAAVGRVDEARQMIETGRESGRALGSPQVDFEARVRLALLSGTDPEESEIAHLLDEELSPDVEALGYLWALRHAAESQLAPLLERARILKSTLDDLSTSPLAVRLTVAIARREADGARAAEELRQEIESQAGAPCGVPVDELWQALARVTEGEESQRARAAAAQLREQRAHAITDEEERGGFLSSTGQLEG